MFHFRASSFHHRCAPRRFYDYYLPRSKGRGDDFLIFQISVASVVVVVVVAVLYFIVFQFLLLKIKKEIEKDVGVSELQLSNHTMSLRTSKNLEDSEI